MLALCLGKVIGGPSIFNDSNPNRAPLFVSRIAGTQLRLSILRDVAFRQIPPVGWRSCSLDLRVLTCCWTFLLPRHAFFYIRAVFNGQSVSAVMMLVVFAARRGGISF